MTLLIVALSVVCGSLIALPLTVARLHNSRLCRMFSTVYISFMRGTPMLAQLFLIYFALPPILQSFGLDISYWSSNTYAIIAFSLNLAACMSEIYRSAYLAVERGQIEAAYSIGLTNFQCMTRIVLPQAAVIALPNFGNLFISLLKETSLTYAICITEILGEARILANEGFNYIESYLDATIIYWGVNIAFERLFGFLEQKFQKSKRKRPAKQPDVLPS